MQMMNLNKTLYPKRQIVSFARRDGRMTSLRKERLKVLWPSYGLDLKEESFLAWEAVFGRDVQRTVEIGFGDGQSLLEMALHNPERDFIGIDVYQSGTAALVSRIHEKQISNLRLFCEDAVQVLSKKIPDNSLDTVQIFFPDPWPKKRHHKRRLIQAEFLNLVAQKLVPEGLLHLATDWEDYAQHMMSVLSSTTLFENKAGEGLFCTRPASRPYTKYEKRGLGLGHKTWDLIFQKQ
jgi:tRNA (guanine-N7-)-methyltransferase